MLIGNMSLVGLTKVYSHVAVITYVVLSEYERI